MNKMILFSALAVCAALTLALEPAPSAPAPVVTAAQAAPPAAPALPSAPAAMAAPATVAVSVSAKASLHDVEAAVARARARGADDNEVYRLRAEALPAQTIAMLGEREQAEKAWNGRIAQWRAESARVANDAAALQALQERLFSKDEQDRLGAYSESATPQLRLD